MLRPPPPSDGAMKRGSEGQCPQMTQMFEVVCDGAGKCKVEAGLEPAPLGGPLVGPSQDTAGLFLIGGVPRVSGRSVSQKPGRMRPEPIDAAVTAMLRDRTYLPWRKVRTV